LPIALPLLMVFLFCSPPAHAAVVVFEQVGDSLVLTVHHEGRVGGRFTGLKNKRGVLADLAAAADVVFDSAGIAVRGRAIPWKQVTVSGMIRQPARGWRVALDTLTSAREVNDDFCAARATLVLREMDFIFGSVFLWGGSIEISGEIGGDVICLGGPVRLRPGAVVRGSVLALGGIIDQQAPAKVYGGLYSDRGHLYHPVGISREWEYEGDRYGFKPAFSYDKADGARPGIGLYFQDTWMTPKIGLWVAYAFTAEYLQYRLYFIQRLSTSRDIRVGGEYFRMTDTEDKRFIHSLENTLVALLANEDYRDYFGSQGGRVWGTVQPRERHTATLTYENFDYRWREAHPELWSLLWTGRDFRENYGALDGETEYLLEQNVFERKMSLLRLEYCIDEPERDRYVTGMGYRFDGFWEIGGGILKGDWSFARTFVEGAVWYDFAKRHHVFLQIQGGMAQHDVPAPKLFYLGGPASLRGYPVKRFFGDEMVLATAEYAIRFWKNAITDASLVMFCDIGRISFNQTFEQFWAFDEFKSDVGVALDFGGGFRLAVAKALKESDLHPVVTVRVKAGL
jgi:hypothetical protein